MLATPKLRVIHVTTHIGLIDAIAKIEPGLVETEFSEVRFHGDRDRAKAVYQGLTPLIGEDIADLVLFCATRPAHVNIDRLVIKPQAQAAPHKLVRRG